MGDFFALLNLSNSIHSPFSANTDILNHQYLSKRNRNQSQNLKYYALNSHNPELYLPSIGYFELRAQFLGPFEFIYHEQMSQSVVQGLEQQLALAFLFQATL